MKTIHKILDNYKIQYPLEAILPIKEALFLDIETTGFSAKTSQLYLIGCAYYAADSWHILQWFAEKYEEREQEVDELLYKMQKEIVRANILKSGARPDGRKTKETTS